MIPRTVRTKTAAIASVVLLGSGFALLSPASAARANGENGDSHRDAHHDTSGPLRDQAGQHDSSDTSLRKLVHSDENDGRMPQHPASATDPVIQSRQSALAAPATSASFDGVGSGFSGPQGTYTVNSAPPDTNSAVGPTQIVEIVNSAFAVFAKTGAVLYGPANSNTLWTGFGGSCESTNDGDAVVRYDSIANRWIITQFANAASSSGPYFECIAVSQSADAMGAYNRYSFQFASFPDYPKLGIWPDAYYMTYNLFNGQTFAGAESCAMDRTSMLAGVTATQQCFTTSSSFGGLLPADLDGPTSPPSGAPNLILATGTTATTLAAWKFHVDWLTPGNSTLSGPTNVAIASYSAACGGGTCIPQASTSNQLDSLADRLMFRLAYRNFGGHEAWVVSHSVAAGSSTGIRWYELRPNGSTVSVFQQGTYAPDSSYRWMSSIAMDKLGNIGLGFSTSSGTQHPGIAYTGRLATDPLGVMTQGEGLVLTGAGSQTGSLHRWGDYSSMSIDPTDDCTFWYSTEYLPSTGSFNWHTRLASFAFPSCTSGTTSNDFSIAATPTSGSIQAGSTITSTISTAVTSGVAQTVTLSATGLPSGASASFNPPSVAAGGSSTMTITTTSATPATTSTITVTGTGPSATHSTTYALTVTPVASNDFAIAVNPTAGSVQAGSSVTSTVSTSVTGGSAQVVALSVTGLPSGASASFSPTSVTAGGSSTMTITTSSSTPAATSTLIVSGTAPSGSHSTTYALTVTAVAANNFSIADSPNSGSVQAGSPATSTISTAVTAGVAQTVTLSASGLPSGASASFSPSSVTAGGNSTMTITTSSGTPAATSTITVTGTGTSATHSTTYALTVNPVTVMGGILNGGFESGTFASWTTSGTTAISGSAPHSGLYAGRAGTTSPTSGTSSILQTFTAPSGVTKVSFWYSVSCPDTVRYDWATASLRDNTTASTTTVLGKTCTNGQGWKNAVSTVVAGHSYTLTLSSRDDNYVGDPTFTQYDDVTLS